MNDTNTPDLFETPPLTQAPLPETPGGNSALPPSSLPPSGLTIHIHDDGDSESVLLHESASRDYLEYAVAVLKGRALPDVRDGMKPVQRRVLYAMRDLGLSHFSKPVKSARVVGDVIGKYHPHGDASAYEAMVRIAQPFTLRYPLVDGQGNFGSRDGDNAAAMRYTEARLRPIANLLLSEINEGTVDFRSNYDGSFEEPVFLPARLPFSLLNGASGIAVGMATEIPPHNLGEVAKAAIHKIRHPEAGIEDLLAHMPGPDYPGGGQIISPPADIAAAYRSGRGSLRARARFGFEEMARGAWQLVVTELPPGVSASRVLSEIGAILNPQPKTGKKTVEQSAVQLKTLFGSQLEKARDESGKEDDVRLVFEPVSSRQNKEELATLLLAHTSLETTAPINLVAIGLDGRPCQKNLADMIGEWCLFRIETVTRRTRFRLEKTDERIHILEGRHTVFLHIEEVIRIIRASDEPHLALMTRFGLSERQAQDILEIRLRQLARLEGIKIEQELSRLKTEKESLERLLGDKSLLNKTVIEEIRADAAQYGDTRRTLIEPASTASRSELAAVPDEPVTVLVSEKGWAKVRQGHGLELAGIAFKEGDKLESVWECRSIDALAALTHDGRAYTIPIAQLPDGRGMGAPLPSFVEMGASRIAHVIAGKPETKWLMAKSSGYGFICKLSDLFSRQKAGKAFLTLEENAHILPPVRIPENLAPPFCDNPPQDSPAAQEDMQAEDPKSGGLLFPASPVPSENLETSFSLGEEGNLAANLESAAYLAALSSDNRLLVFPLEQMKRLSGGKGIQIMRMKGNETLMQTLIGARPFIGIRGVFRGKTKESTSEPRHLGQRARRGADIGLIREARLFLLPEGEKQEQK